MKNEAIKLSGEINRAVIKFRGVFSAWAKKHGISYNEMLVLYTIRDNGFCTQKQICDSYLLPRQTINNVISIMRKKEFLTVCKEKGMGREKAFILTDKGKIYAEPLLKSLSKLEIQAIERVGFEYIKSMAQAIMTFDKALKQAMEEDN